MKKRIFVNPLVYVVLLIGIFGLFEMVSRVVFKRDYVNLAQEIATYFVTAGLIFSVIYLGKYLINIYPLDYNNEVITIKRLFRKNITIKYKDIRKIEFYNRYNQLIITSNEKKYRFSFLLGLNDFKKIVKKRVGNVED